MTLAAGAAALTAAVLAASTVVAAQERDPCDRHDRGDRERACEVREWTVAATGDRIEVDAEPNGGIRIEGWDRDEIEVRAVVRTHADSEEDARALVDDVRVEIDGTRIRSDGPRMEGRAGWSVSYRLRVPRRSDLELESTNGSIAIRDVRGDLRFDTTNGSVELGGVAGSVRGETTNGGIDVSLAGDRWEGSGLDVETTNGGIDLRIPEGYDAELETGTTNGGLRIDFPITIQGRIDRRLRTTLGEGGPRIRAVTTNGSIHLRRG